MLISFRKKEEVFFWTKHSKEKMRQYNLSEKRVLKVLRKPDRKEEGVAPGTIAAMQKSGTKKNPKEVWVMYQTETKKSKNSTTASKIKIISAWRYPGKSPLGKPPPIPEDILEELSKILFG